MEWYDYLKDKWNLDVIIIILVFLSGFFQERFLKIFTWVKDARLDAAWKTLVVSLIVSTIYIVLIYKEGKRTAENGTVLLPWGKYFISFFAATSLYDFAIRPLRNWIKKKTGDNSPDSHID